MRHHPCGQGGYGGGCSQGEPRIGLGLDKKGVGRVRPSHPPAAAHPSCPRSPVGWASHLLIALPASSTSARACPATNASVVRTAVSSITSHTCFESDETGERMRSMRSGLLLINKP
eukprot:6845352-Pyramimonas_sp.AAC.1